MKWYARYCHKGHPICGTEHILIMDGRWNKSRALDEARHHPKKGYADSFILGYAKNLSAFLDSGEDKKYDIQECQDEKNR